MGNFGGVIIRWHDNMNVKNCFFVFSGLVIEVVVKGLNKYFKVYNAYGPYLNKCPYSDKIFNSMNIQGHNIIMVGDLNFTLNSMEIWGFST